MKKIITFLFSILISTALTAQFNKVTYTESDEELNNPERGFYLPTGTRGSHYSFLDAAQLSRYRHEEQQLKNASYPIRISLIYRGYELDIFKDRPISDSFLTNIQKDFDVVRASGLKIILRFMYTNNAKNGNCKDEYKICPPYGDAPVHIVLHHIQQLKPLLQKNADVIAVLQEGFIGIWGENYFTDYFGDASDGNGPGKVLDSSWRHRNQLLKALLDALPKDRTVQVRTPQIKQRFVYGPGAPISSAPLTEKEFLKDTYSSRVGFHNDCFLASPDDYGTFADYGNSNTKRDTANIRMRNYFKADSRYVAVGGETCDDAFSPQNDCAPAGYAEQEMEQMHYSYLNAAYNNQVNNDWDSLGCMKRIKQRLGYRLVLREAQLPVKATAGKSFSFSLQLENVGFAAPYNPRPVQLIFRHKQSGQVTMLNLVTRIQTWYTGPVSLKQIIKLPSTLAKGEYELLLNLPDGYKSLQQNPDYSIQLANTNMWEEKTGYNKLNHTVVVE